MLRALAIAIVLLMFCSFASAQDKERVICPSLSVKGPSQNLKTGETARFNAQLLPHKPEWQIRYQWYLSYGTPLNGQGTSSVEVERPPSSTLVVTVNIAGGPDDSIYPSVASEMIRWDVPSEPEKIGSISGAIASDQTFLLNRVRDQIGYYPNDILYVFLGTKANATEDSLRKRKKEIEEKLGKEFEKNRLNIVEVVSDGDITEFWRVPLGSNSPVCEACIPARTETSQECPTISVTGPAGVVNVGEIARYTADIDPKGKDLQLSFEWTASLSEKINIPIHHGQGTRSVEIIQPESSVTATIVVKGLPEGCPTMASETSPVSHYSHPHPVDDWGKLRPAEQKVRLDNFLMELERNPKHTGYIVLKYRMEASTAALASRVKAIFDHLKFRRFGKSSVVICSESGENESAILWRLTPEYGRMLCSDKKIH